MVEQVVKTIMRKYTRKYGVQRVAPWTLASQVEMEGGESLPNLLKDVKGIGEGYNYLEEGYMLDARTLNDFMKNWMGNCYFQQIEDGFIICPFLPYADRAVEPFFIT